MKMEEKQHREMLLVSADRQAPLLQFPAGAFQFLSDELFVRQDGLVLRSKNLVGEIVEGVVGLGSSLFGAQDQSNWRVLAGLHPVLSGVVEVHMHLSCI